MKNLLCLIALLFSVQVLLAWGKNGHLIVGQLADQYLTPKTRAEVKKILGEESFAQAGIWMDIVSSEKQYRHQENWHYAYKDAVVAENAVVIMEEFSALLADPNVQPQDKVLALRAVIHVAGDIHVPMHCGYTKDDGGHTLKLTWAESGEKTNLHKVWDTDMIHQREPDVNAYVTRLQGSITKDQIQEWGTRDFNIWVGESQELLSQVYDFEGKVLQKSYYDQHIIIVDDRLSMSAVRLAYLLNSIFDPQN